MSFQMKTKFKVSATKMMQWIGALVLVMSGHLLMAQLDTIYLGEKIDSVAWEMNRMSLCGEGGPAELCNVETVPTINGLLEILRSCCQDKNRNEELTYIIYQKTVDWKSAGFQGLTYADVQALLKEFTATPILSAFFTRTPERKELERWMLNDMVPRPIHPDQRYSLKTSPTGSLTRTLVKPVSPQSQEPDSEIVEPQADEPEPKRRGGGVFSIIPWFLLVGLAFLLIRQQRKSGAMEQDWKTKENEWAARNQEMEHRIRVLEEENRSLKARLEAAQLELEAKSRENANPEDTLVDTKEGSDVAPNMSQPVVVFDIPLSKHYYFPAPIAESTFKDAHKTEEQDGLSLFHFKTKAQDQQKATFSFLSTPENLLEALKYPGEYLEAVCEYENSFNKDARSIRTLEDGEAQLDGPLWRVVKKARIRFEQ